MRRRTILAALLTGLLGAIPAIVTPARAFDFADLLGGVNLVGTEQEAEIAATFAKEIESKKSIVGDRAVQRFVDGIGARLARGRRADFPWRFRVLRDPAVNAYNIGGGYVYVNTGLLAAARSEGEVAAVVAHEMGHQAKRHVAKTISRQHLFQSLASLATGGGESSPWLALAANLGITTGQLHFTRDAEREADRVMVDLMIAGGYDPRQALAMFDMLRGIQGNAGGGIFSSHPPTRDRAEAVRKRIASRRLPSGLTRDSRTFQEIRSRVR